MSRRINQFFRSLTRNWLTLFNIIIAIYVGLPAAAPVLMNAGATAPAKAIYFAYSPFCHQMASRSFFLFGEQSAYPRELAGTSLTPIEAYMDGVPEFANVSQDPANWAGFTRAARQFLGNEEMGYKMALCERDMGIYTAVLLGGLVYGFLRKRMNVKALPFWLFILVGIGPIGLDGFSQLFGQYGMLDSLAWLGNMFSLRESTPFLRTFTGSLFGFALVWLTYPHIDEGMYVK